MAHSPYDVTLGDHATTPTTVKQITSLTHNTGSQVINAFGSGEAAPAAIYQGDSPHSSQLQTTDMATLLALNTSTFISAGLSCTLNNTDVPFRKRANYSTYASGASHDAIRATAAMITPDSISGQQGESATIDATLRYISSDGFTSPVSVLTGQTLSTATLTGEYILHSVVLNGTTVPELQSVTINPGLTIVEQKEDGGPFSTALYITEIVPTIEIQTQDLTTAIALADASALASGGCVVYFAKRASGAIIESTGSTEHISVTGATGLRQATTVGGDSRSNNTGSIRIHPFGLTAATGVAIS